MDMMQMFQQMTWVAKLVAFVLLIMSMWSLGVGIERFFTYTQARNQSKLYAPQVAKHLKDGRLKDAIALSTPRTTAIATSRKWCSPDCRNISSSRKAAARWRAKISWTPSAARSSARRR